MSKLVNTALCATSFLMMVGPAFAESYGLGRVATPAEVTAWDIDVRPDGQGLPEGQGNALDGEEIYSEKCAACHGDFGEGIDRWPVLVGGIDTLENDRPVKTVGSYWPYASTIWDYVNRAMPFGEAQSLESDEVYAITAYLLYMNDIIEDDEAVISRDTFGDIEMPNADGFIPDNRADADYMTGGIPCMSECTDAPVTVTMRARILDVTPESDD